MTYEEAKATLLDTWGSLGSSWGINRTMAQIHILLLISPDPLCTEDIMEELNISRGNANMNLRALIDWGVVFRKMVPGERKEYFYPEKNIWEMAKIVARERRKRELAPALKTLKEISTNHNQDSSKSKEMIRVTDELIDFSEKAENMLEQMSKVEKSRLVRYMLSLG